jgi:hypothetical protein
VNSARLFVTLAVALAIGGIVRGSSKLGRPQPNAFRISSPSNRDACSMLELFDQVARQARTPLGFENAPGCWFGPRSVVKDDSGYVLRARTAREAFDEVAAFTETFSWREIDGVVVVRPISAWDEADSFLSLRVDPFQLLNVSLDAALYRALDATTPRLRYSRTRRLSSWSPFDVPMSADFAGGTLMAALTRIVRAKGDAEWRVGYANGNAAIQIGPLSTLASSATALVAPISWTPSSRAVAAATPR